MASVLLPMLQRAGYRAIMRETTDWVIGDPKKRPYGRCCMDADSSAWQGFDVGVADPTRAGVPFGHMQAPPCPDS